MRALPIVAVLVAALAAGAASTPASDGRPDPRGAEVPAPAPGTRRPGLAPDVAEAVERVLACERPGGGWTYVCNPATGPHGVVTKILVRARQLAALFGGAEWDVLVLRSPGTPAAGEVMLDAWRRSGDVRYLDAARRAGDLLAEAQLPSGGWASEMPVRGARLVPWFRWLGVRTALDDDVTSGAARFLAALWTETREPRHRDAASRALDLLVTAQLDDGAWPLTWRAPWIRWASPSFEDLPSTNDGATGGPMLALIAGARLLGRDDGLAAARRGGEWLLRARGPATQPVWAQQYDADGRPGPARRFEPAGYAAWESREMLDALAALAGATGEPRWCEAFPGAVDWYVRSAIAPGCWARLYEPGSNAPLYATADGARVATPAEARRPYKWTGDFGVPGLFATLGLDVTGARLDADAAGARLGADAAGAKLDAGNAGAEPAAGRTRDGIAPLPPRRMIGDAGACPGATRPPHELAEDDENPRARIVRAAILLQRGAPPAPSPCRETVLSAARR